MGDIPNRQTAEPQVDRPRMGKEWMKINGPSILVWGTFCILVMASTELFVRLWQQTRSVMEDDECAATRSDLEFMVVMNRVGIIVQCCLCIRLLWPLTMGKPADGSASTATTADSEDKSNDLVEGQAVMEEKSANLRVVLSDLEKAKNDLKMAKEYLEESRKELEELNRSVNALLVALQKKRA
ncbi:uncharacterized protein B0T23DRAFT_392859 [Neurospora hispaniola]|uniref:Uncharacterized protein n=1 Tax=Neurospora hispaniola TaxID=588809 RepID=A0AAJ0IHC9_9PEZI|nr:hypothetical protein B0T23DRAFT_392859 [Neurospora hispaniola]